MGGCGFDFLSEGYGDWESNIPNLFPILSVRLAIVFFMGGRESWRLGILELPGSSSISFHMDSRVLS